VSARAKSPAVRAGRRILIIEDEPFLLSTLRDYFVRKGYEVQSALNGVDGLMALRKNRPDLVLLDLRIPGGGEVRGQIRSAASAIPVIIVSGNEGTATVEATLDVQAFCRHCSSRAS